MKPVDIRNNTFIDSSKEVHDKDPKFKVCDRVRIWKYKIQNVSNDLNGEEIIGIFYEKDLQKTN